MIMRIGLEIGMVDVYKDGYSNLAAYEKSVGNRIEDVGKDANSNWDDNGIMLEKRIKM